MMAIKLILFALMWLVLLYAFDSLLARRLKRIQLKQAAMYFFAVALIGVFGEIFLDTTYKYFVGQPLWRYNVLPIHNAYTSAFAPIIWGLYGLHLYFLHDTLGRNWLERRSWQLVLIFSFEALILEALLTLSAYPFFGHFMYYYYPGDLWHVTSVQNMPFYFICGAVILRTIKRFKADPVFFSCMSAALIAVVVVFAT
jgi:hypothetical protein